ncbi:MAG: transcriptional repressor NrdR [Chloroflexi bacterium]|nr:transcriptional repressor NrdR [Chloroflexota bacterium]
MKCPHCGYPDSKVVDSRDVDGSVRRRRECLSCQQRFTTYERIEQQDFFVVKKDGRREAFDRSKLLAGVRRACEKRPLPTGAIERLVNDVEAELRRMGRVEVPSAVIGELVMERLRRLDQIAYIRFASVYRAFTDLDALRREVETLSEGGVRPGPPVNQLPLFPEEPTQEERRRGRRRRV